MAMFKLHEIQQHQSGFSLIEVLVSMSIFTIVVTVGVGSLLVLIDANAKAQNTQAVINNVAFVVDSMVRDVRTGYHYHCSNNTPQIFLQTGNTSVSDCAGGGRSFAFTETGGSLTGVEGGRIGFRHNAGARTIERCIGTSASNGCNPGSARWQQVTAPDVEIDELRFVVTGTDASTANNVSPMVTIYISGRAGAINGIDSSFELQTTITQLSLDI